MPERKKLDDMVPSEIVRSLNEYVIGQDEAKRTIAIAIRNRVRRKRLPEDIRDEVTPKNILSKAYNCDCYPQQGKKKAPSRGYKG